MDECQMNQQLQQMMNLAIHSNLSDAKPRLFGKHTPSSEGQSTSSSSKQSTKLGKEVLKPLLVKSNKPTNSKNTECEASNQNTSGTNKPRFYLPSMWRKTDNGMLSLLQRVGGIGQSKLSGIQSI